jgi:hypothetical protein
VRIIYSSTHQRSLTHLSTPTPIAKKKKIEFYWIPGHCGVEVNESADSEAKKAETVNYYYQWQILKPIGKRKAKRSFTGSVKTPTRTEYKTTLKGTTGMACLRDLRGLTR